MSSIPARDTLATIAHQLGTVVSPLLIGTSTLARPGRLHVLHWSMHGLGAHVVPPADAPAVLRADGGHATMEAACPPAHQDQPIEWWWQNAGVGRVVSACIPGLATPTRLWVGLDGDSAASPAALQAIEDAARQAGPLLVATPQEADLATLRRLEAAAAVLPALLGVLDVREVFTRLSGIGGAALPHDLLTLGLFDASLTAMTVHMIGPDSRTIEHVSIERYPVAASRAFDFDILDDRTTHPIERDRMPTGMGMRSSLRLPLWVDGQVIGGLGFNRTVPGAYSTDDVVVGRRLAEIVAVALSHQRLAERLAEEARRHEELRSQAASLELLDRSLVALTDGGAVSEAFARFAAIAQSVLPHDAASVLVRLPDGKRARRYASVGLTAPPEVVDIPQELLDRPDWVHDVIDDMQDRRGPPYEELVRRGFRSLLRVSLRHGERFAGVLVFTSRQPHAFPPSAVALARRIADRITLTLARDRELEEARRANEATERAAKLEARVRALTEELDARTGYRRMIGESVPWREVLLQATRVAATETTVLLLGESGTGKEVVARFVHRASPRSQGPFVALNCAALPEQLLEAELFGYERGAFTGAMQSKPGQLELAAGGTLLLDEVGEMSASAQAKFLRVLQEREFKRLGGTRTLTADARIVAATNRDLRKAVAQGQFREDLYYRLDVFAIRLPPLRDRRDDILPLCDAFVAELARGLGRPPAGVSREARQALMDYAWPGNVRELRNIIERAAILCDGGLITTDHLSSSITAAPRPTPAAPDTAAAASAYAAETAASSPSAPPSGLQSMERTAIEQALAAAKFNRSKAAAALGLTRHQLYLRMKKYGLD
jgi:transcriptional regulator with GAF, ATPase, and Fis domain